jgi:hypothetical protein
MAEILKEDTEDIKQKWYNDNLIFNRLNLILCRMPLKKMRKKMGIEESQMLSPRRDQG